MPSYRASPRATCAGQRHPRHQRDDDRADRQQPPRQKPISVTSPIAASSTAVTLRAVGGDDPAPTGRARRGTLPQRPAGARLRRRRSAGASADRAAAAAPPVGRARTAGPAAARHAPFAGRLSASPVARTGRGPIPDVPKAPPGGGRDDGGARVSRIRTAAKARVPSPAVSRPGRPRRRHRSPTAEQRLGPRPVARYAAAIAHRTRCDRDAARPGGAGRGRCAAAAPLPPAAVAATPPVVAARRPPHRRSR